MWTAGALFLTGGVAQEFWDSVAAAGAEPLSLGEDLVDVLQREHRYYRATAFERNGETIHTVRVRAVLLARSDLDNALARRITRVLVTSLPEIRASTDLARSMLPGTVRANVSTRWHPGADRYYCSAGFGGCVPVLSIIFLGGLALLGIAFVALGFSSTLRAGLVKAAPRFAAKLVGPYGMTDRYRYLVIPVLISIIILADETVDDPDSQTVLTVLQAEKHAFRQTVEGERTHELRSIAELVDPEKKSALESVHTDLVLCPQEFSEKILLQALLNPSLSQFLGDILTVGEENQIVEVPVHGAEEPPLVGKTFDEAMVICRQQALLLLAIHRGGAPGVGREGGKEEEWNLQGRVTLGETPGSRLLTNPSASAERDYRIQPGDSLLFLAHSHRPLAKIFGSPEKWRKAFKG